MLFFPGSKLPEERCGLRCMASWSSVLKKWLNLDANTEYAARATMFLAIDLLYDHLQILRTLVTLPSFVLVSTNCYRVSRAQPWIA